MTRKRYIAIHTFHSDKSKEAFYAFNAENPKTDQEMLEAWTFEKCQLAATWFSDDDFFFCHWLAESDQDIHQALTSMGLDDFVFTACYETTSYIDINLLPNKPSSKKFDANAAIDA